MSRGLSNWSRPPHSLRRPITKSDNIALVPASELASLATWQYRAQQLSAGNTLIVVPHNNLQLLRVGHQIKATLTERGRRGCIASIHRR